MRRASPVVLACLAVLVLGQAAILRGDDPLDKLYLGKRKIVDDEVGGGFVMFAKSFELKKAGNRAKTLASHVLVVGSPLQIQDAKKILARLGPKPPREQDADTEGQVEEAIEKYRKHYEDLISYCEKKKLAAEADDAKSHMDACLGCRANAGSTGEGVVISTFEGMTEDDKKALARVNFYRKAVGLAPVSIDGGLCMGCRAHCNYLVLNNGKPETEGLKAHDEVSSLPGYTPEGERAGKASDIAWGTDAPGSVDCWVASLYHRVPVLDPDLQRVGFGYQKGISCLDLSTKRQPPSGGVVTCPADGAKDVPRVFDNEMPDPIPPGAAHPVGFPITITGYGEKPYSNAEATLEMKIEPDPKAAPAEGSTGSSEAKKAEWKQVPIHFSSPDKPARQDRPDNSNSLCILPQTPLLPKTTYRATFNYSDAGGPTKRVLTFKTGD